MPILRPGFGYISFRTDCHALKPPAIPRVFPVKHIVHRKIAVSSNFPSNYTPENSAYIEETGRHQEKCLAMARGYQLAALSTSSDVTSGLFASVYISLTFFSNIDRHVSQMAIVIGELPRGPFL
jgi:hypothetical protein